MTYDVFGGMLSLTQSINQSICGSFLWGCIPPLSSVCPSINQGVHSKCSFWQYGF